MFNPFCMVFNGVSQAKEINLADYGIDLSAIVMSGAKITEVKTDKVEEFRQAVFYGGDIVFLCDFGGMMFKLYPCVHVDNGFVALSLIAPNPPVMIHADVCFVFSFVDNAAKSVSVLCNTTTASLL